ncbi:2-polyprenylphenol 6-hydroxylase [Geobacter pelophilus]|uniref:2-polyprenylphenol 6-hydroxylase n=1 Tax=Geoanaerobacter pelophilus TaxID=60036 RepID=A0AAW4LBK6_9BACT|nr:2-polyprenylphenol 6-hydroxylase [Geoanaerobacter pelophilus]MBT0665965.1 2-polyprenylphenol 6-hydroxylase [Geoanaerobacter pelophilus]
MLNIIQLNRNIRTIRRYRQISRILFKYGFDHILEYLNIPSRLARGRRLFRQQEAKIATLSPAERMRLVLEELGPTFIKLGQILSTRPDVIPRQFVNEFAKLQDMVPAFSIDDVRSQVRHELHGEIEELFSSFDIEPIAAASIAQVHRATMLTGENVVVKIRRPNIEEQVETDIDALFWLAQLIERHIANKEVYEPVALVREFARTIRREMDFTREGHTIEKIAANFTGDPTMYFPKVYWNASSRGILTLEFIDGIKVSEHEALANVGMDLQEIARRGANAIIKMVLEDGFFHGDPHPGNVFIMPGNVICLLDYGMVGRLDEQLKNYLLDVLVAIIRKDVDEVIDLLLQSGDIADTLNTRHLRRDISEFIDSYYEIPLREIEVGRMFSEFIEVATTHQIKFQADLMLLSKTLITVEGMGRELDPGFDMVEYLRPFIEKAIKARISPRNIEAFFKENLKPYLKLARTIPRDVRNFLARVNRNNFKIDLEHRGLDRLIAELDKSINRLSSSLIIAALIVGSSIVMQIDKGPKLMGFPLFAFMGYSIAGMIGFLWLIAIIRSGRL